MPMFERFLDGDNWLAYNLIEFIGWVIIVTAKSYYELFYNASHF